MLEPEGPQMTSQYGAYALRAGLARRHGPMRMHMPTRWGSKYARMHARAHAKTHIDQ